MTTPKTFFGRVFHALAWVSIMAGFVFLLTLGYWKAAPYQGLVDVPQPFHVHQKFAPKGTMVTYTVKYCVDQSLPLPLTVQRSLELQNEDKNAAVGVLPIAPPIEYEITQRCETRDFFIGLPMYVPLGLYHIHTSTVLQVNPVRQIRQSWVSEDFTITEPTMPHSEVDEMIALPAPIIKR